MKTKLGVNFFGSYETDDGIGRAAALNLQCLREAGIEVDEYVLSRPVALQSGNDTIINDELLKKLKYKINIFQFSARWVPHYFSHVTPGTLDGFYNIGYWFCEVPKIPSQWAKQLRFFKEIWTSSTFCQNAIIRMSHIPVINIPLFIEEQNLTDNILNKLNKYEGDKISFLTVFNTYSDAERKNILFSLRAFIDTFSGNSSVEYIVKVSNLEYDVQLKNILLSISLEHENVNIIDGYVPNNVIQDLYDNADVYVSLHRAEGYGLTISDAMAKGIPVITTDYSGNMEFCRHKDTNLVESKIVNIGHERLRYRSDDQWAELDLVSASSIMSTISKDYPSYLNKAQRARERLRQDFSISTISKLMEERLTLISSGFFYTDDLEDRDIICQVEVNEKYGF